MCGYLRVTPTFLGASATCREGAGERKCRAMTPRLLRATLLAIGLLTVTGCSCGSDPRPTDSGNTDAGHTDQTPARDTDCDGLDERVDTRADGVCGEQGEDKGLYERQGCSCDAGSSGFGAGAALLAALAVGMRRRALPRELRGRQAQLR